MYTTRRKLALLLLAVPCFGQLARYDSQAIGIRGPIPNASVAICSFPTTNVSTTPCTPLATLFSEAISTTSVAGGIVTVTTAAAHGLAPGTQVSISGVTGGSGFNGLATVASIPTTTTFTFANGAASGSGTGGTVSGQNQLIADGLGNFFFLASPGRYTVQIYGPQVASPYVMQGVTLPCDPISNCASATGVSFANINTGTNTTATMTLGSGSTLSFGAGAVNGTLANSNTGVFTNTQGNQYLESLLNSCSSATEYNTVQTGNNATDALSGCVAVPLAATVHQQDAVSGYINTQQTGGSGGAVAGYFQARVLSGSANGPSIWGINPIVQDVAGPTGEQMMDAELDMNVVGSPARAWGILFTGNTTGTMPVAVGSGSAMDVRAPGYVSCVNNCTTAKQWVAALNVEDSAASSAAINIGATSSANSTNSMPITLNARDSGGTLRPVTLTALFNGSVGATLGINNAIQKLNIQDKGQCTMAAGTCTAQTLNNTYTTAPICIVTWTGTGALAGSIKVASSTTTVTPSSSNGADTAVVNWICIGS